MLFKLKTGDVQLIQILVDNKQEEIEGEKLQLQCIVNTEDEWKKRVKMTQNNKFIAMYVITVTDIFF